MNINVVFDNGGGISIITDSYAHYYHNAAQAAEDYKLLLAGADTTQWDGNEYASRVEYDVEQVRNNGYIWLDPDDIASGAGREWGDNTQRFYEALEQ